jgi:TIR domain
MAMRLYSWLRDFQFIERVWIDIKELRPGAMLTKSILQGIDRSDIVIILVSKKSKDSPWVKQEIEYALKHAEKGEKIVIPVLYRIAPKQIPITDSHIMSLLEHLYISLDEDLFIIHRLIPPLIPDHYILEIPVKDFQIELTLLIDNLTGWSSDQMLYAQIDHETFDTHLTAVLKEPLETEYSSRNRSDLDIIRANFLPKFWINVSYVLSKYITSAISNGIPYESLSRSISNLIQELFFRLSTYLFGTLLFSIINNDKRKKIKKCLNEHVHYLMPKGNYEGALWFLCKLYYDSSISPYDLIKLSFVSDHIYHQSAYVSGHTYDDALKYMPTSPSSEIHDSDWYEIIVPQFLSGIIIRESRELKIIDEAQINTIGLELKNYSNVYGARI